MTKFFKRAIMTIAFTALVLMPLQAVTAGAPKPHQTQTHSNTALQIKFVESDEISLANGQFISSAGKDLTRVNSVLHAGRVAKKSPLFTASRDEIKARRKLLNAQNGNTVPDLSSYYRIELNQGEDITGVIAEIKQLPNISEAYAEPLPVEPPISPDYSSMQTHFTAAPTGMGISASAIYPGALGDKVKIADLEYSWNTLHEDLSDTRQTDTKIANGIPSDPFLNNDHGTAVAGLINGDRNSYGINGIISNSKLHLVNTNNERGWDMANAIYAAQTKLTAGDVMLIEQQTWGPDGHGFVPVEWVPSVYDAIKVATLGGINVIESAGNGSENLDASIYGTSFPQGKIDSGAVMVGAGSACYGTTKHSRLSYSNYGRRVNVQGYGECVTSAGYGNLYSSGGSSTWYTNSFGGTSSASALVAGLAGSISSSYEYQKNAILSPLQVRTVLISTGTAQDTVVNPGNIGPLPNLLAALKTFSDITPPTTPTNLRASLTTQNTVQLNWNPSTDSSGPVSYKIYRNNVLIATTANPYYTNTSVTKNTWYAYKVRAADKYGNLSAYSSSVSIKTR